MGLNEAIVAQGMATRHKRSVPALVKGFSGVNGLLNKMLKNNKIKWGGYGVNFDWYAGKLNDTATWSSGQLGTRTFEEKDPAAIATLPYCLIDATYGVSEKSIKSNRAAGENKIYDIQAENAANAQHSIYNAFATAMYYGGTDTKVPVGLVGVLGGNKSPYWTADTTLVHTAAASYAGIAMVGGSNITAWAANKASYANAYWAPEVICSQAMPTGIAASKIHWTTGGILHLADMESSMAMSSDMTGTGDAIKPDMAFMRLAQYQALIGQLVTSMVTYNVQLADQDLLSVGIKNVKVGGITAVYDTNVPLDNTYSGGTGYPMVLVVDSSKFSIETYNTKSEGLVEAEWKQDDPTIVGGVGVYKSSFAIRCETPNAVGCILLGDQA